MTVRRVALACLSIVVLVALAGAVLPVLLGRLSDPAYAVARTIAQSGDYDGAVVAHMVGEPARPAAVWRVTNGALNRAGKDVYAASVGDDRAKWPRCTLLIYVEQRGVYTAVVKVGVRYNAGLLPTSRGGRDESWWLQNIMGRWTVVGQTVDLMID